MKIRIEESSTILCIKHGRIENEDSDLIINWLYPDLRSGPASFYHIHEKAGVQLFNAMVTYEVGVGNLKECDAFTTIPGQLDCKMVLNAILPNIITMYPKLFFNISETIKEYKKRNICNTLSIFIPCELEAHLMGIKNFLLDLGLHEINIMYLNTKEHEMISAFVERFKNKETKIDKLNNKIEQIFNIFGSKRRLPKFIEDFLWDKKKKKHEEKSGRDIEEEKGKNKPVKS